MTVKVFSPSHPNWVELSSVKKRYDTLLDVLKEESTVEESEIKAVVPIIPADSIHYFVILDEHKHPILELNSYWIDWFDLETSKALSKIIYSYNSLYYKDGNQKDFQWMDFPLWDNIAAYPMVSTDIRELRDILNVLYNTNVPEFILETLELMELNNRNWFWVSVYIWHLEKDIKGSEETEEIEMELSEPFTFSSEDMPF